MSENKVTPPEVFVPIRPREWRNFIGGMVGFSRVRGAALNRKDWVWVVIAIVVAVSPFAYMALVKAFSDNAGPLIVMPAGATEVKEYFNETWQDDLFRCVKATLPEEAVAGYAARLGLEKYTGEGQEGDARIVPHIATHPHGPEWWYPPTADDKSQWYYKPGLGDRSSETLVWHDGSVYYLRVRR
jgi:hypothetical protein